MRPRVTELAGDIGGKQGSLLIAYSGWPVIGWVSMVKREVREVVRVVVVVVRD